MKVLTEHGFKDTDGVKHMGSKAVGMLNGVVATPDHKFKINGKWVAAGDHESFIDLHRTEDVYDFINVKDVHSFIGSDQILHNCLYLDEFAFVNNDVEFYTSTYPVITGGNSSKVIITSTPNGLNLFHKLYSQAERKLNEFVPLKVLWNEHPHRDATWKQKTINNIGLAQFRVEFECVAGDTFVEVYDMVSNEYIAVTIEQLYTMLGE